MNGEDDTMEKVGENGFHAAAADDRTRNLALLQPRDSFARRHLGPRPADIPAMLETVGVGSLDALIDKTVPASIRLARPLNLPPARGESAVLAELAELAAQNFARLFGHARVAKGAHGNGIARRGVDEDETQDADADQRWDRL